MSDRPTLKDVAARAGVSPMTVSRVVNGEPGVGPETAARVERAIRDLGYQRDAVASQLRRKGQLAHTIGLLVDNVADPFMAAFASAVEDVARQRGNVVLIGTSRDDLKREREVIAAFTARRVDGLIIIPVEGSHRFLQPAVSTGTHVVCADRRAPGLDVDTVIVDNREGVRDAVAHLIAHGHRRIAFLGDRKEIWTIAERHAGYLEALAAAGLPADPALVRNGLRHAPDAATAVKELLEQPDPPTAVFAGNDIVAVGALETLPPSVAMVAFGDFVLATRLDPPVTIVYQDPVAIGTTAAHLLFARIHGDLSQARTVVLPTHLIVRGSGELPPRSR
ncbi:LacI family DNA-binding transcriptional regulator [Actinocorallia longicatena]|uniref:LacI family DNA-binding transcriptional regulator n=1 Tax=Actinocorallia longicatena TaxID=111803 RepID=A0ABP6QJS3_9ACTN